MKARTFVASLCFVFIALIIFSCSENTPPEPKLSSETETAAESKTPFDQKFNKVEVFNQIHIFYSMVQKRKLYMFYTIM